MKKDKKISRCHIKAEICESIYGNDLASVSTCRHPPFITAHDSEYFRPHCGFFVPDEESGCRYYNGGECCCYAAIISTMRTMRKLLAEEIKRMKGMEEHR